jgi:AcrR family transcriptional regulator
LTSPAGPGGRKNHHPLPLNFPNSRINENFYFPILVRSAGGTMTREKLKAAALKHFAKSGYEGTSLAAIAKEVGIKPPSVYAFFSGKDDLLLTVFDEAMEELQHELLRAGGHLHGHNMKEKLFSLLKSFVHFQMHNEQKITFIRRTLLFPPEHLKERLSAKYSEMNNLLSKTVHTIFAEDPCGGHDPDIRMQTYLCLLDGIFLHMFLNDDHNQLCDRIHNIGKTAWSGLAASGDL